MSEAIKQYEALTKELNEAMAQRAQVDEKITAIRNVLQGVGLGVELQKAADAEKAAAAKAAATPAAE